MYHLIWILQFIFILLLLVFTLANSNDNNGDSNNNGNVKRKKQKPCQIQWMHPPKTASTFCLTIQHACNETQFLELTKTYTKIRSGHGCMKLLPGGTNVGNRYHHPLWNDKERKMHPLNQFVTILRHPFTRIVSAFCDNMHAEGQTQAVMSEYKDLMIGLHRGNHVTDPQDLYANFEKYVNFRANHGCYVKMLTGYDCHEDVVVTPTMAANAVKYLSQFKFVGIYEEYNLSVELFLKQTLLTNTTNSSTYAINSQRHRHYRVVSELISTTPINVLQPPHEVEITKLRKSSANHNNCSTVIIKKYNKYHKNGQQHHQLIDAYDYMIYKYAKNMFDGYKNNNIV